MTGISTLNRSKLVIAGWFCVGYICGQACLYVIHMRGSARAACRLHRSEVAGSNPAPTSISRRGCLQTAPACPAYPCVPVGGRQVSKAGRRQGRGRQVCLRAAPACQLQAPQMGSGDTISILQIAHWTLRGIWAVESNCGRNLRRGDGGKASGHLQQHRAHWERGCQYLSVRWRWPEDTYDFARARAVAIANWRLDCWSTVRQKAIWLIAEEFARRFRLPNDPYRADNDIYWQRVRTALEKQRNEQDEN